MPEHYEEAHFHTPEDVEKFRQWKARRERIHYEMGLKKGDHVDHAGWEVTIEDFAICARVNGGEWVPLYDLQPLPKDDE